MKAGTTFRFDCQNSECMVEFEVTYEPKAKGNKKEASNIEEDDVTNCPFCGSDTVEES